MPTARSVKNFVASWGRVRPPVEKLCGRLLLEIVNVINYTILEVHEGQYLVIEAQQIVYIPMTHWKDGNCRKGTVWGVIPETFRKCDLKWKTNVGGVPLNFDTPHNANQLVMYVPTHIVIHPYVVFKRQRTTKMSVFAGDTGTFLKILPETESKCGCLWWWWRGGRNDDQRYPNLHQDRWCGHSYVPI